MAALPTAITGTPPGPMMPATNWATPRATAAASNPAAAPVSGPATVLAALRSVRPVLLCVITVLLRSVAADRGLAGRGADSAGRPAAAIVTVCRRDVTFRVGSAIDRGLDRSATRSAPNRGHEQT